MDSDEVERRRALFRYLKGQQATPPEGIEDVFLPLMQALVSTTPAPRLLAMFERVVDDPSPGARKAALLRVWCAQQPNPPASTAPLSELVAFAVDRLEAAHSGTAEIADRFRQVLVDAVYPAGGGSRIVSSKEHRPIPDLVYLPPTMGARYSLVSWLLGTWLRPIQPSDGVSEAMLRVTEARLGCPLPLSVRTWFGRFGAARDLWDRQDRLLHVNDIHFDEEGFLNLVEEARDDVFWQISEIDADDPPVWVVGVEDGPYPEAIQWSEHAVQLALSQIKWQEASPYARHKAMEITPELIEQLKVHYPECDVARAGWPDVTRWFAAEDLVVEIQGSGLFGRMWATARTKQAARRFDEVLGGEVGFRLEQLV